MTSRKEDQINTSTESHFPVQTKIQSSIK